jgi:pimeloyl-ACP methyl ester carboxylesterase
MTTTSTTALHNRWISGAGVGLHAATAGDPAGPPVILLHGFPEFWYGWRHQIGPLARAGFHVTALDQRGYNRSDKPPNVADYAMDKLVADVVSCLDGLGYDKAAVVGHDWGGAVGWALAALHPERVSRLVVANCPHPRAMRAALEGSFAQLARSWYVFAAQIPGLPERVAGWADYGFLTRSMRETSRPGTFTERDFARYRRAWSRPGAMTAMVNWYRAAARHTLRLPEGRVRVPTLLLWGQRDRFLRRELAPASAAMCDDVRLERFPTAGHWLLHEEPAAVNRLLVEFLGATSGP